MNAPVVHHFECQVGSQYGVPMTLIYLAPEVCIEVARHLVWTVHRGVLAEALVSPVPPYEDTVFVAHTIDDLVVMDLALTLPLHLVMELAEVEQFLAATYAADPVAVLAGA